MNEQNPASDLNLGAINDEYDLQIANLKSQLLIAKEERKKTENEFYLIKNRLTKLKNQEITNNLNFQNIKYRFKLILKNRAESNRKINDNFSKFKAKKLKHLSPITNKYFFTNNKNNNMNNNGKNQNKTHSNFYSGLNQKILNENNNYKNYLDKKSDYSLNSNIKENDSNEEELEKNIIKKKILEKLKDDQEEKRRIEEEIAKIEEEELLLINEFNKIK
jgi:hypothetical protein